MVGLASSAMSQEPGTGEIPQIVDIQPVGDGLSLSWREVTDARQYGVRWRPVGAGDDGWTTYRDINPDRLDFARQRGTTTFHLVGSCRMGPDADPLAVVDDRLRVRGIDGLRVADASIVPRMPSANTNAAALMIAEKAADMLLDRPAPMPVSLPG